MSASFQDTNGRSGISPIGFFSRWRTRSFNRKSLESGMDMNFQKSEYKSFSSPSIIDSYLDTPYESNNGNTSNSIETDSYWSSSDLDEDITLIDYKKFHGNFSKNDSIANRSPTRWHMPFLAHESTSRRKSFDDTPLWNQRYAYNTSRRISLRRLFQNGQQDCNVILNIHENKERNTGELLEDWPH